MELGGDHRFKLDRPHIQLALIIAHSLKDHANDVTQVLVSQMIEPRHALEKLLLVLIPHWDLLLLDEKGCQDDNQAL